MSTTEREVLIRLKVQPDTGNAQAFRGVATSATDADKVVATSAKKMAQSHRQAAKDALAAWRHAHEEIGRQPAVAINAGGAASTTRGASVAAKADQAAVRSQLKSERERAKLITQRQRAEAKAATAKERAEAKAEKDAIRHDQRVFTARMRSIKTRQREEAKAATAHARSIKQAERAETRSIQQITRARKQAFSEHERHLTRETVAKEQMAERFNTLLSDTMRLGRGLAMIGLVGEENTEKLLKGLLKIQATFDIIGGSVGTVLRLSRMWRDYTTAVKAAAAAQTALATAQGITTATSASAGAAPAIGRGAGLAGTAAASAVGTKIAGTAAATTATTTTTAAGATAAGGAGIAGTIVAGVGAVAGGLVGLAVLLETGRDIWEHGLLGGATPGSLSEKIAGAEVAVADWTAGLTGYDLTGNYTATQRTKRLEGKRAGWRTLTAKETARRASALQHLQQRMQGEGMPIIQARLADSRGTVAKHQREGDLSAASVDADRQHITILQRVVELRGEEKQRIEESQSRQLAGARAYLGYLDQQRKMLSQTAKEIRDRGKSTKERFGALSLRDRAKAQLAFKQVKEGTANYRTEAIAERYGAKDIQDIISQRRNARATKGGYDETYGTGFEAEKAEVKTRRRENKQDRDSQQQVVGQLAEQSMQSTHKMADQLKELVDEMRATQERVWGLRLEDMKTDELQYRQSLQQSE